MLYVRKDGGRIVVKMAEGCTVIAACVCKDDVLFAIATEISVKFKQESMLANLHGRRVDMLECMMTWPTALPEIIVLALECLCCLYRHPRRLAKGILIVSPHEF